MSVHLKSLPRLRVLLLLAAPLLIAGLAWGVPLVVVRPRLGPAPTPVPEPREVRGAEVYARHCAECHGPAGDGRGSSRLDPPARAFGRDKFHFATTANGVPCDDDLMRLLRRGIPGSAMPAFPQLTDAECEAVIAHVRMLTRRGAYARQVQEVLEDTSGDRDMEPAKFARLAAEQTLPGAKLAIPHFPQATKESIARGAAVYAKLCASCHGPGGRGDGSQVAAMKADVAAARSNPDDPASKKRLAKLRDDYWLRDDGSLNVPRDLTIGQYKAGGDAADLYARIMLGIPGTPMPASNNQPQKDIFDLIHYLRSLPQ